MDEVLVANSNRMQVENPPDNVVGPGGDGLDRIALKPNEADNDIDTQGHVMQQVESLMRELDEKREADKRMVDEFRARMQSMVDQLCHQVEERMLSQHQETNKKIELKLQKLNEIVGRVCGLESELHNFKSAVGTLFKDISQ